MAKRIAILGSTGSVGRNALRVAEALGAEYQIVALSGHSNFELLAEQARKYRPGVVAITNAEYFDDLSKAMAGCKAEILAGPDSLLQIAQLDEVDIIITAPGQVDGAQVFLEYQPEFLQVIEVLPGAALPVPVWETPYFDNSTGQLSYAAGSFTDFPKSSFTLVTIRFNTLKATPETPITFVSD